MGTGLCPALLKSVLGSAGPPGSHFKPSPSLRPVSLTPPKSLPLQHHIRITVDNHHSWLRIHNYHECGSAIVLLSEPRRTIPLHCRRLASDSWLSSLGIQPSSSPPPCLNNPLRAPRSMRRLLPRRPFLRSKASWPNPSLSSRRRSQPQARTCSASGRAAASDARLQRRSMYVPNPALNCRIH